MDDTLSNLRAALSNLKIIGFEKTDGASVSVPLIFEAMFNPNSYVVNHRVKYCYKDANGSAGGDPTYVQLEPQTFSIEFLIDGTGASKPLVPVVDQIQLFNDVTSTVQGNSHRPNYLIVQWGSFIRDCVFQSATITYTLFTPEGIPLRAKVNATFMERKNSELNARANMFSSPDLTHLVDVKQGDILPLTVYKTYRDQKYYLQVAKVNRLKNFRKLIPGTKIILPPIAS